MAGCALRADSSSTPAFVHDIQADQDSVLARHFRNQRTSPVLNEQIDAAESQVSRQLLWAIEMRASGQSDKFTPTQTVRAARIREGGFDCRNYQASGALFDENVVSVLFTMQTPMTKPAGGCERVRPPATGPSDARLGEFSLHTIAKAASTLGMDCPVPAAHQESLTCSTRLQLFQDSKPNPEWNGSPIGETTLDDGIWSWSAQVDLEVSAEEPPSILVDIGEATQALEGGLNLDR